MRGISLEKGKLQTASPTAMLLLLPPPHCELEGVAFEALACLLYLAKTLK